jgi:hypothetical protein
LPLSRDVAPRESSDAEPDRLTHAIPLTTH